MYWYRPWRSGILIPLDIPFIAVLSGPGLACVGWRDGLRREHKSSRCGRSRFLLRRVRVRCRYTLREQDRIAVYVGVQVCHVPTLSDALPTRSLRPRFCAESIIGGAGYKNKSSVIVFGLLWLLNLVKQRLLIYSAPRVDRRLAIFRPHHRKDLFLRGFSLILNRG